MKLTFSPASPFARVRIAAIELGLIDRIEFVPAKVVPAEPNDEYARDISPLKKLPALILDRQRHYRFLRDRRISDDLAGNKLIPAAGAALAGQTTTRCCRACSIRAVPLREHVPLRSCAGRLVRRPLGWAWNGVARFEKQADVLSRPLDIVQIGLVCVLGYADFRFADCGWHKAYPKLDAFPPEDAGTAYR